MIDDWFVTVTYRDGTEESYYTDEVEFDDKFTEWIDDRGVKKLTIEIIENH